MKKMIAWVEIPSADFERAVKFYGSVFDIDLKPTDCGNGEKMACFPTGEGAIVHTPNAAPSETGTIVSFTVPDGIDAAIARIEHENGKVVIPKTKVEGKGHFAVCIDTENNKFGLYE